MSETAYVVWDPLNRIWHDSRNIYYIPAPGEGNDGDGVGFKVGFIKDGKIRYFEDASEYIAKIGIKPGTKLRTKPRRPKSLTLAPGSD